MSTFVNLIELNLLAKMMRTLRSSLLSKLFANVRCESMFHASALCHGDVLVPHMGDSISEGTVAAILKKQGDSVNVDDVLVQIETDKVTIDCKSTESGLIQAIMVQSGSVVKPGQVVASISAGAPGTTSAPSAPKASAPVTAAPRHVGAEQPLHAGGRVPGIHFPARRTASGERISDLPADQHRQLVGSHEAPAAAPSQPPPLLNQPSPTASAAPVTAVASKPKVVTTILDSVPARRQLTPKEVEMINSGGV